MGNAVETVIVKSPEIRYIFYPAFLQEHHSFYLQWPQAIHCRLPWSELYFGTLLP